MKSRILLVLFVGLLSACSSSGGLTSAECSAITEKKMAILKETMPPGNYPTLMAMTEDANKKNMAKCVAGDGYDRADHACFMAASTLKDVNDCERDAK